MYQQKCSDLTVQYEGLCLGQNIPNKGLIIKVRHLVHLINDLTVL